MIRAGGKGLSTTTFDEGPADSSMSGTVHELSAMPSTVERSIVVARAPGMMRTEVGGALREQLHHAVMLLLWAVVMIVKMLLIFVPYHFPSPSGIMSMLESHFSERKETSGAVGLWTGGSTGNMRTPISRALVQVLELMNEIPASSRKYAFTRDLAEKIIEENAADGAVGLEEVNRVALEAGFSRTIRLLTDFLEESLQRERAAGLGWAVRLFKSLPSSSVPFLPVLTNLWGGTASTSQSIAAQQAAEECGEASEKFGLELLWMAQKLKESLAIEAAIVHWSSASRLATLSHSASSRVQRLLVKLSAFLCVELASRESEAPTEMKLKFLLLWLPLFCNVAPSSAEGTIFTAFEKQEVERMLERMINSLPKNDQETVLALWLREFSISSSDWPNLQGCYDRWCHESRRSDHLNFLSDKHA